MAVGSVVGMAFGVTGTVVTATSGEAMGTEGMTGMGTSVGRMVAVAVIAGWAAGAGAIVEA